MRTTGTVRFRQDSLSRRKWEIEVNVAAGLPVLTISTGIAIAETGDNIVLDDREQTSSQECYNGEWPEIFLAEAAYCHRLHRRIGAGLYRMRDRAGSGTVSRPLNDNRVAFSGQVGNADFYQPKQRLNHYRRPAGDPRHLGQLFL